MKFILASILLFVVTFSAQSQNLTFIAGAQVAFPNGNLKTSAGTGVGVFGRFNYNLSSRLSAIATIEGTSFAKKTNTLATVPAIALETKVGIETLQLGGLFKLMQSTNSSLYIGGELGVSGTRFNASANGNTDNSYEYDFCYRYSLGYSLKRWDARFLQQFITNGSNATNFFGLQFGYLMYFKK